MDNHEYKIYVEIAYQIFQKCFEKDGISEDRGWPTRLSAAINKWDTNSHLDSKALSDLYGRIKKNKNGDVTYQEMYISEKTLDILSRFASIPNYKIYNENYKGVAVAYTPRPFRLLNLLRIPSDGILFSTENSCTYQSDKILILENKTLTGAEPYCMPGDYSSSWVKVSYETIPGEPGVAYFALIDPEAPAMTFINPEKLVYFFNRKIKKEVSTI